MKTRSHRLQRGFTLTELLVASTIGILVIGGAIAVFSANQTIGRTTEQYQLAQDDFRYVSQIITRVVRDGDNFAETTTSQLEVEYKAADSSGRRNCLGEPPEEAGEINQFSLIQDDGHWKLQCKVGDKTQNLIEWPISNASDAEDSFDVAMLTPSLDVSEPNDLGKLSAATPGEASSVEVTIRMRRENAPNDVQTRFVVTMRCRIFGSCP